MQLSVVTSGFKAIYSRLDRLADGSWRPGLMAMVGELVQRQTIIRIRSEKTAPSGAAWAALAASTLARKGGRGSILIDKGNLVGSITSRSSATTAVIGTSVFYGGYLQDGTSKMPARPFVGLSDANESQLGDAVQSYVASRLGL